MDVIFIMPQTIAFIVIMGSRIGRAVVILIIITLSGCHPSHRPRIRRGSAYREGRARLGVNDGDHFSGKTAKKLVIGFIPVGRGRRTVLNDLPEKATDPA